jgi:hypothetical protein
MSFFAQPALGTNTVAVAHDQQADHQFRIDRRAPNRAVKVGEVVAQIAQIGLQPSPRCISRYCEELRSASVVSNCAALTPLV